MPYVKHICCVSCEFALFEPSAIAYSVLNLIQHSFLLLLPIISNCPIMLTRDLRLFLEYMCCFVMMMGTLTLPSYISLSGIDAV
jgi:hypothetical protein